MGNGLILTCAHMVPASSGGYALTVRGASQVDVPAALEWCNRTDDVALLSVADADLSELPPCPIGTLPVITGDVTVPFVMYGWPRAGDVSVPEPDGTDGQRMRDSVLINGVIKPAEGIHALSGLLRLRPDDQYPSAGDHGYWKGMSGAAIFCAHHIVAVQTMQQQSQLATYLSARPLKKNVLGRRDGAGRVGSDVLAAAGFPTVGKLTQLGMWLMPDVEPEWTARPELYGPLLSQLINPEPGLVGLTGLHGAGGFGKTTLAVQVCADDRVRARFREGVWVTIGEHTVGAALADRINDVYYQLARERPALVDPEQAGLRLGKLLDTRPSVLLVVDDIWTREQLAPFLHGGKHNCTRLITTRKQSILPEDVRRDALKVDELSKKQTRELLTYRQPELASVDLTELVRLTGRWPLLVQLARGRLAVDLRDAPAESAVADLVKRLRQGPTTLNLSDERDRRRAVAASIEASLSRLALDDQDRFVELGIFVEDIDIPRAVIGLLWQRSAGLDEIGTDRLCEQFDDLGLLAGFTRTGVRLHDVIRAYLRDRGRDRLASTNQVFLRAAEALLRISATSASRPWWLLPANADYLWRNLCWHLAAAGLLDELAALVTDLRWVEAQLRLHSPAAIDVDLTTLAVSGGADPTAATLRHVVGQNAHLLISIEPAQAIADTLISRLRDTAALREVLAAYAEATSGTVRLIPRWPLPDQPHPALRRVLTGHTDWILSCAVAPDASWLATTSKDKTVRIWEPASGLLKRTLVAHTEQVLTSAAAPDGTWLATAGRDRTVRIWDTETWGLQHELPGHTDHVEACAASPDGTWLATTGRDMTARVWDPVSGVQRHVLTGHTDSVVACAAPDAGRLATASRDGTVRVWDPDTGDLLHVLKGHVGWVETCVASPTGDWLASADTVVRVWDLGSGTVLHELDGHTAPVVAGAAAPDGSWLATASWDGTVRVWDPRGGSLRHTLIGDPDASVLTCVAAPDGSWLASAGEEQVVRVWDPETGQLRHTLTRHAEAVAACAVAPDGAWLASASWDKTVRLWDPAADARQVDAPHHAEEQTACVAARTGHWLATTGRSGTVRIWDAESGALRRTLAGHEKWATAAVVAPDESWLATTSLDHTVRVWDPESGLLRHRLTGHAGGVLACAVPDDGGWLASTGEEGTARIWDPVRGRSLATLTGHTGQVVACTAAPDGTWLATASLDGTARIWETATGRQLHVLDHNGPVRACAAAPDGSWLVTTGSDAKVRFWDPMTGTPLHTLDGHADAVWACTVASDGTLVATVGADWSVQLWDPVTRTNLHRLTGHAGTVVACAFAEYGGAWLATAGHDSTVRIWDVAAGKPVTAIRVTLPVKHCAWIPGTTDLAVVGEAGLYLFSLQAWLAAENGAQ